ncbi:hypothetical protein [Paracoccus actinidiae]|uniref:hypothetical protein n=1 Tax=Paracoccus actinidiae TaxID=3064531 RepID=UPI0027D207B6|nr:hypothetical protein [Paracoccus sp. M09]
MSSIFEGCDLSGPTEENSLDLTNNMDGPDSAVDRIQQERQGGESFKEWREASISVLNVLSP